MRLDHLLSMENVRGLLRKSARIIVDKTKKDGRDEIQSEGFRASDLVVRLSVTARAAKRSLPDDTLN